MIHFLLLQNRQGKTRMSRYFSSYEPEEKRQLESEVHKIMANRDRKYASIVEFRNYKVVYKRYASLFFAICIDVNDNELVYLESIHLFVELLDKYFSSVCELDLVFNFHKIYPMIDEMFMGGEVQETSKRVILDRLTEIEKMEAKEK